jgi:hypothetical protein
MTNNSLTVPEGSIFRHGGQPQPFSPTAVISGWERWRAVCTGQALIVLIPFGDMGIIH